MVKSDNRILELSFSFSLQVIELYKKLQERKEFVISKQVLRSATSIGANVEETIAAQSRKSFYFKDGNIFKRSEGNKILVKIT